MSKIIAIVGLSKNAGKTSFLNWYVKGNNTLSPEHRTPNTEHPKTAITTTGRDGEDIDLVTGDKKPKVILPAGVLFTSFEHIYDMQAAQIKALEKLPFRVIGKNLWLYQTLGQIETEVVGPATRKEQEMLIEIFKTYLALNNISKTLHSAQSSQLSTVNYNLPLPTQSSTLHTILIDGSIDRKSICLSDKITDIVLVVGASAGDIHEIKKQATMMRLYSEVKRFTSPLPESEIKSIYGNEKEIIELLSQPTDWIYFPGMLTEASWGKLKSHFLRYKGELVFHHPLNISLPMQELQTLINTGRLSCRVNFPLSMIAVNSYSPHNEHIDVELLKREIKTIFPDVPVIDVTEMY